MNTERRKQQTKANMLYTFEDFFCYRYYYLFLFSQTYTTEYTHSNGTTLRRERSVFLLNKQK